MKINKLIFFFILSLLIFFLLIYFSFKPSEGLTKFIVKKNYKYFVLQENNNRFLNLYLDLVVQNYFKNNFLRKENDINIITKKTKNFFVDQNESFFYGINPLISKISIGGVLFYGFGACESINGILGLRLSKEIKNIELFSLYDNKKNISPHTILKLSKDNIIYFIDIWGLNRNIKYTLNSTDLNKELNLDVYNKKFYKGNFRNDLFENGFVIKKYNIKSLLDVGFNKLINIKLNFFERQVLPENKINVNLENKTKTNPVSKKNLKIEKDLIYLFVDARFKHLRNNISDAKDLYSKIVETNCEYDFCKVSKLLLIKNK